MRRCTRPLRASSQDPVVPVARDDVCDLRRARRDRYPGLPSADRCSAGHRAQDRAGGRAAIDVGRRPLSAPGTPDCARAWMARHIGQRLGGLAGHEDQPASGGGARIGPARCVSRRRARGAQVAAAAGWSHGGNLIRCGATGSIWGSLLPRRSSRPASRSVAPALDSHASVDSQGRCCPRSFEAAGSPERGRCMLPPDRRRIRTLPIKE